MSRLHLIFIYCALDLELDFLAEGFGIYYDVALLALVGADMDLWLGLFVFVCTQCCL